MLIDALDLQRSRVIALCGAGGKTTLLFALARECVDRGERVLLTTTTKIGSREVGERWPAFAASTANEVLEGVRRSADAHSRGVAGGLQPSRPGTAETLPLRPAGAIVVYASTSADGEKLIGLDPGVIDVLSHSPVFDRILVEADGSARRPLKAPGAHEPVIPASTGIVIAICGLSGVGLSLVPEHVFRPERWSALTGVAPGADVTPESVAAVAVHPDGLTRGAPSRARRVLFLNQADTPEREATGRRIADLLSRAHEFAATPHPPVCLERVVIGRLLPSAAVVEILRHP